MELVISISLLSIASYFAANLVIDMGKMGRQLEVKNALVSVKTMLEGVVKNYTICTSNLGNVAFDMNGGEINLSQYYADPAKTRIFIEVDKKPNINVPSSILVKSIKVTDIKYIIDASAVPVSANLKIQSGANYFFKGNFVTELTTNEAKSIYSNISIPITFEASPSTGKIINCASEIATIVKYEKNANGGVVAGCNEINLGTSALKLSSNFYSANGYCTCSCIDAGVPTCPGGSFKEGGVQRIIEPNSYQIVCSDPVKCTAHIDMLCKLNIGK